MKVLLPDIALEIVLTLEIVSEVGLMVPAPIYWAIAVYGGIMYIIDVTAKVFGIFERRPITATVAALVRVPRDV